jgi:hypothetical protein
VSNLYQLHGLKFLNMPTPNKNETKDDYLQRCMVDSEMQKYDPEQRYAVCNSYWKEEKLRNIFSKEAKTVFDNGKGTK